MSWTKHFRAVPKSSATYVSNQRPDGRGGGPEGTSVKYSSLLPEVYAGHPQRIQRYFQYADMDKDSDVSVALSLIADFCTQSEEQADNPFRVEFLKNGDEGSEAEIKVINEMLTKWTKVNNFRRRMWTIFRKTVMNGDSFFLRDPETHEWTWLDHFSVLVVRVDEEKGKVPVAYAVRGLDLSRKAMFANKQVDTSITGIGGGGGFAGRNPGAVQASGGQFALAGAHQDGQNGQASTQDISMVDAKHVVHLSLSIGMDNNWPFGESVLDPLFKTFKQKEMLEDAIIIYRVQRAPERRVFYIDVGDMPAHKQQALLTKIKNEMHSRHIPTRNGGGTGSMVDGAYSPLAMQDDYYFANTAGGRGSKVDTLPGGENVGQIGDVDYFNDKFARALGIPPSYLAINPDRSAGAMFNDGKGGSAAIQEFRFNKFCMRLQALLEPTFDAEFKTFVKESGGNVDDDIFELRFNPPQNFSKYRQIDLDTQQMSVFAQVAQNPIFSKRFVLERFANMTDEEIQRNEELWAEENPDRVSSAQGGDAGGDPGMGGGAADFGDLGIRSGGGDDLGLGDDGADPGDPAAAPGGDAGPVDAAAPPPPPPPA